MKAHSVICEVQIESLCYRASGPHEYSETRLLFSEGQAGEGTSESHWQFPLCVHKRKFVLPLIRQQNYDGMWRRRRIINLDDGLSASGSGRFILVPTSQQT